MRLTSLFPGRAAVLWALLVSLLPAAAEEASNHGLTRDGAIQQGIRHNPELAVARLEIDRAKSRLRWAGRLENPELELSGSTDQLGLNDDESVIEIAFSQRFPITSRLRREKEVRRYDVELAEIEFQVRQRQLAFEVDKAWIELQSMESAVALRREMLGLNREISTFLAERAKLGEVSSLDASQALLSGTLIEQELQLAESGVADAMARLGRLMGSEPGSQFTLAGGLALPQSAPLEAFDLQAVLRNRPDYASLLVSTDLGKAQLGLAMAQRWDDIAVKIFAEREQAVDEPGGLERNSFIGIGISIPLPLHKRNEQAIEEAKIDLEKARRARVAKAFEVHSELTKAMRSRSAAHRLITSAVAESLPLAKKNFEAFRNAQQSGRASWLQVQQAQAQLLQLETSALELRKRYDLLDAEVRFIAGTYPIAKPIPLTK